MTNGSTKGETDALVVLCTLPSAEAAAEMARKLVEERACACVNIVPGVRSIYRWDGKISDDAEVLCVIKTRRAKFEPLRARIAELHSYDVPEIIALPVERGHAPYLDWLADATV
jgi:periplasmic divalent cation tolerance protein